MKVLLLCESGPLGLKVLYCLKGMGASVQSAGPRGARMLKYSRYTNGHSEIQFWQNSIPSTQAQQLLRDKIETEGFEVVVPSDMGSAAFLAATKKTYPDFPCFPCSDQMILDTLHNKWSFAQVCAKYELPVPPTILLESSDQLDTDILDPVGFPLIVKPLEAESSHGVVRLDSRPALQAYIAQGRHYARLPLIAQAYIPGHDIDISILAANDQILCSTVQSWLGDGVLEFTQHSEMHTIATRLVQAFHYEGLAHFDMRIDARDGKLYVIECNPRAWYTISASMWQGLNFIEMGIQYAQTGHIPEMASEAGTGTYFLPGSLWKQLFSPHCWKNISIGSIRGFIQAITDPLPHLHSKLRG